MISYLDDGIVSKMSKFADDAKLCSVVGDDEEAHILWGNLTRMLRWLQDLQMFFNLEKCSWEKEMSSHMKWGGG